VVTVATGLAQPALESGSRAQLTKLVYAALFLIATTVSSYFLMTDYDVHLVRTKQFGLERTVMEYLPLAASLFCFVQLSVILSFFRSPKQMFDFRADVPSLSRSVSGNVRLGFFAGLVALLATLPTFLGNHRPSDAVMFLANHFYSASGLGLLLLQVLLIPVAAEIFFRGILLRQLLESISVVAALICLDFIVHSFLACLQLDRRCCSRSGCRRRLLPDEKCACLCCCQRIFHCQCHHVANIAIAVDHFEYHVYDG
jgi:membrane protease YdiL (CAAX protease family)